ncbi:MAG: hypothetical protein GY940_18130, partial [bacterium]|nr:hypothetical protein [bacterium]
MKKTAIILALAALLIVLQGCKKNAEIVLDPIRISYLGVRPQLIGDDETAWITVMVRNLGERTVLVKTIVDRGITNPQITSTTGNAVYVEFTPPDVDDGETTEITVRVIITDPDGTELDIAQA